MALHPDLPTYTPDFIVRDAAGGAADGGSRCGFVYVDQAGFEQYWPQSFAVLVTSFRDHQETP